MSGCQGHTDGYNCLIKCSLLDVFDDCFVQLLEGCKQHIGVKEIRRYFLLISCVFVTDHVPEHYCLTSLDLFFIIVFFSKGSPKICSRITEFLLW
jgi:hypothetical protein